MSDNRQTRRTGMTHLDFSQRADLVEEMDRPDCDISALHRTLRRFELTNPLFTRYRALLHRHILHDMRRDPRRSYRLTDLGAGGCDIPRWLLRRCRKEGLHLRVRAIEQDARVLQYARRANADYPEIETIEANACDPACWGQPDYVFSQHLLHHLSDTACREIVRALDRAALRRFVINDLLRSRVAYGLYALVSPLLSNNCFIARDGLLSIRRSFTMAEAEKMRADIRPTHFFTITHMAPNRLVICGGHASI